MALQEELVESVATGKSVDRVTKGIMDKLNVSYNNARRLARTELSHTYNQSTLNRYIEAGITDVQILTVEDDHTCEECKAMHKKIFPITDAPLIPIHPNCRCVYQAVIK